MIRFFLLLSLPLFAIDQFTKWLILERFPIYPSPDHIEAIPGFFNIVRVHNTGMAFGLLNGSAYANYLFGAIALIALTAIAVLWKKNAFPTRISQTAAALLVAGILGNFTDRILPSRGYVVDFLDFYIGANHWPSFNVADSCICIAAVLLVYSAFTQPDENPSPEAASTGSES
jgi:signal peptidase II